MRILLTGTYNSRNKGDAAMQLSAAAELRSRGHEVIIATPETEIDGPLYGHDHIVRASRREAARAVLNPIRATAHRLFGRQLIGNDPEIDAMASADLVIDLSGDMLTEDYGTAVALSHFQPLLLSWILGRPYAALAQSIGPFHHTSPAARFLLRRALLVTAREHDTIAHLERVGVTDVSVTADLAFLLEPTVSNAVPQRTRNHRIGISLSELARTHHGERDLVMDVAAALRQVAEELDVEFLGIPHVTGPTASKDDRLVLEALRSHGLPIHVLGDLHPAEMKGAVATCDLVVGARMHANIAALSSGVPVVALAYSHKFAGIMAAFDQSHFVLDLGAFDSAQLTNTVQKLWNEREDASASIHDRLVDVRRRARANFDLVLDAAERGPR